jgi:hypothetical protein
MIFENTLITGKVPATSRFLKIRFDPTAKDSERMGLKIWAYHGGAGQFFEYTPYRGYKSTVDFEVHIGLGNSAEADSVVFQWPDGRVTKKFNVAANTMLIIKKEKGPYCDGAYIREFMSQDTPLTFKDAALELSVAHRHDETSPIDLNNTYTLLHNLSQHGPSISVADINGDGLDDFFTGSDPGAPAYLFIQQEDFTFSKNKIEKDRPYEDMGSLFFDADGDGDPDLYVVSGGSTLEVNNEIYQDRLYLNNGSGNFSLYSSGLPEIRSSGSCVTAADYDLDGDLDLFVGGRIYPGQYPTSPKSYLLENNAGKFSDQSSLLDKTGGELGVVNTALWTDINNDGRPDLIVAGEWMPVKIYINTGQGFSDHSARFGTDEMWGWWNSISGADFDNDGDTDYILGNYGLNSYFKASPREPVEIHVRDFDNNGTFDPLVTHYIEGKSYLVYPKDLITAQIPAMKTRFRTYELYGATPFEKSFLPEEINGALHLKCTQMRTIILENVNGKSFNPVELPIQTQFSPVYGIICQDFNNDFLIDLLLVGNSYADETITGYYDASPGALLINKGNLLWEYIRPNQAYVAADGDKKAAAIITAGNDRVVLVTANNGPLQALKWIPHTRAKYISLLPGDWYSLVKFPDGKSRKTEFYYGSGYLSQDSRRICINNHSTGIKIVDFAGKSRNF